MQTDYKNNKEYPFIYTSNANIKIMVLRWKYCFLADLKEDFKQLEHIMGIGIWKKNRKVNPINITW